MSWAPRRHTMLIDINPVAPLRYAKGIRTAGPTRMRYIRKRMPLCRSPNAPVCDPGPGVRIPFPPAASQQRISARDKGKTRLARGPSKARLLPHRLYRLRCGRESELPIRLEKLLDAPSVIL